MLREQAGVTVALASPRRIAVSRGSAARSRVAWSAIRSRCSARSRPDGRARPTYSSMWKTTTSTSRRRGVTQLVEERDLGIAGREHGVRRAPLRHRGLQHVGRVGDGSDVELTLRREDPDPQPVDPSVAGHRVGLACGPWLRRRCCTSPSAPRTTRPGRRARCARPVRVRVREIADAAGLAHRGWTTSPRLPSTRWLRPRVARCSPSVRRPGTPSSARPPRERARRSHRHRRDPRRDRLVPWLERLRPAGGARFDGHPWTQEVDLEVTGPDHPATRHLGRRWRMRDEVYQFRDLRADAQVLLRVPPSSSTPTRPGRSDPSSGFRCRGASSRARDGCSPPRLGHFPSAWESPAYLQHVAGGLAWACGAD